MGGFILFQLNNIAPSCGRILGFEVVFDGVGEDFGFTFTILLGVLLGADDDGFGAVELVDAVDHFVKSLHLFDLLGGDIE